MLEAAGVKGYLAQLVHPTYRDPAGKLVAAAPAIILENVKDTTQRIFGTGKKPIRRPYPSNYGELAIGQILSQQKLASRSGS